MDFKISINCGKCDCTFELRPVHFKSRDVLECPNCGQSFPNDAFEKIKTGLDILNAVPETMGGDCFSHDFTVKVKEYNTFTV